VRGEERILNRAADWLRPALFRSEIDLTLTWIASGTGQKCDRLFIGSQLPISVLVQLAKGVTANRLNVAQAVRVRTLILRACVSVI